MDKLQMRHQPTALTRLIRLFLLMLAALPVLLASAAPAGAQDLGDHDIVSFEKSPEMLERLRRLDLDLLMERDGRIYAVVGARDLLRLTVELVPFRIDTAAGSTPKRFHVLPVTFEAGDQPGKVNESIFIETDLTEGATEFTAHAVVTNPAVAGK